MTEFKMPILGADMEAGTLVSWLKQPGDAVHRGDIVAEVETDKAIIQIEIFMDGVIEALHVQPGERVAVGTPLAAVHVDGEVAPETAPAAAPIPVAAVPTPESIAAPVPASSRGLRITPAARRLAGNLGIDVSGVKGSGPDGRIQIRDIDEANEAVTAAAPPPPVPTTTRDEAEAPTVDRQARVRQAIAAAMTKSHREIPAFHLYSNIDMRRAMQWLSDQNQKRPASERLIYSVLFIKAVASALHEVPELNATWTGDRVALKPDIHVGMSIALRGGGLIVPALHYTNQQNIDEIMQNVRDLVRRARAGTLRSSELTDGTITITSLGEQGAEAVFGIIYPPQAALVGFGKVSERPWSVPGGVVSRPVVTVTLTADHRVTDGQRGSLFLRAIDRLLQEPDSL